MRLKHSLNVTAVKHLWRMMSYLERGGDGEWARLDLREQIQEIVYFQFGCSVGEICQDLQQQEYSGLSEQVQEQGFHASMCRI